MNNDGLFELALFPIPGCVSFPHSVVPLHVFEPRYRQMVEDCISKNLLLGVCHTKSIERLSARLKNSVSSKEELHQLYQQNLSTFGPEEIFGAGPIEILEKTEDGRYVITVQIIKRFRLIEMVQNDPYKIGRCREHKDCEVLEFVDVSESAKRQRETIVDVLQNELAGAGVPSTSEVLDIVDENCVNDFTFKLFRFIRLPEFQMQDFLNSTDPLERLDLLHGIAQSIKSTPSSKDSP